MAKINTGEMSFYSKTEDANKSKGAHYTLRGGNVKEISAMCPVLCRAPGKIIQTTFSQELS